MTGWASYVIRRIFGFRGERLSHYFDDLELEKVVPQLLQYVQTHVEAKNFVWVVAEEFKRLRNLNGAGDIEGVPSINRDLNLFSSANVSITDLHRQLARFRGDSLVGEIVDSGETSDLLVPIVAAEPGDILAYVFVMGCPTGKAKRALGSLNRDVHYMAKHISFSLKHWRVQQMTLRDDLTGLYNQKFLVTALETEISRCQRHDRKFTVLFMDIDYFKSVNDTMGHWVGSRLLVEVGRVISQNIRKSDYPFRYGGDEFVVILSDTGPEGAIVSAERLRERIERTDFYIDGENIKLTLSIGLATYPDHAKTHKDIIKMADEAMYCGKNKSRNIVYVAS